MYTTLLGMSTAVSWAVADIFIAQSTRTIRPLYAAAWVNLIGAILFGLYYLIFIRHNFQVDSTGIILSGFAGFMIALASAFFFTALHKGPVGIVSALSSTYPAVTLILAVSIFGAAINARQSAGFSMVIIGVVTAAGFHVQNTQSDVKQGSGTFTALMAALSWGIGYGVLAEGVKLIGWESASLVQFGVLAGCCLLFVIIRWKRHGVSTLRLKTSLQNPYILGAAVTQQVGAILLNIGLSNDTTGGSIIVALSACYPVLTTIMAYFIFKERIPILALAGGLLAIIGIIVLSY
jgi:drug/metabolite transporter (DMT)-like permease